MAKCEEEDREVTRHVELGKALGIVPPHADINRETLGVALEERSAMEDSCPYRWTIICPCPGPCDLGLAMNTSA